VPEVTLVFWIIKILATTLGETGGDAVSMSGVPSLVERFPWLQNFMANTLHMEVDDFGYLVGIVLFGMVFIAAVIAQIRARKFHPSLYWITIIATTTVGTVLADYADRSLGIGYLGGSLILLGCVVGSLLAWYLTMGSISVKTVATAKVEIFYWVTIMFSQTLGTALGDWTSDTPRDQMLHWVVNLFPKLQGTGIGNWMSSPEEIGFVGGVVVFGTLLAVVCGLYFWTKLSRVILFWLAFVLTRPLGAVVGDLLDKPHNQGGLALSRYIATGILVVLIVAGIWLFPQRAAKQSH